ncbi:hypothetical protein CY34DRAFT_364981 [Suillus luteus UH-Slu-Lm8-n1]|uniref:Uncharacterized protein n=1 Tax=Suillus luteus UH-Slu-Lm8-n1 TaxID=930992 RepID=A0A0D0AX10_9AGAM|nr:hypothetical protein CY34DRAFT_364981 [Suillus luteus UH-Slu-Lm8-n1]
MNPPESKDNKDPWSFNHRTRAHYTFDSESDPDSDEAETDSKVDLPSDDTRLIQELDISSRHETVDYKPNPWSIARINAVSRPPNKELPGQAISEDVRQKSQPRGRIVDAFKVQAERKPPRAPPPLKAPKFTKPKATTSQVSREHQVCSQIQGISNAKPGDHSQHDNALFLGRGSQPRFSDMPAILSSNDPHGNLHDLQVQPHPDVPTQPYTPDSKRDSIQMSRQTLLQRSAAHISTPDVNLMPQSRYNASFMSMSSPLTNRDFPVKASHLRPGGYQSSPPRPFNRDINTSPRLLPYNQSSSHFRRGARLTDNQRFQALSALPVPQVPAVGSYRTVPPAIRETGPPSMPQWLASTIHSSLNPPPAHAESIERALSPARNETDLISPESRKRPYQSPTPSPPPQRAKRSTPKRNIAASSVSRDDRQISAYAFDDDPDANWSTVMKPVKKKSNKFKPGNIPSSGPFRLHLPGISVGNSKSRSTGATRTEKRLDTRPKRRVITYLPPPLPQRTVAHIENSLQIEECHVPDDPALSPGSTPAAQSLQESGRVSPLPHAESDDLTLVGGMDEHVVAFDAGEVKARYPKVRKLIKETRVMLPELLGLPSCGVVWRDDDVAGADDAGNREIKMSVWPCIG